MPDPLQTKIAVNAKCIFAGSCFAENLGAFLQQYKFNVLVNPTGIIFNPIAIANALETGASNTIPSQDRLFNHVGLWRHPDVHSNLAHPNRESAWNLIKDAYRVLISTLRNPPILPSPLEQLGFIKNSAQGKSWQIIINYPLHILLSNYYR